MKEEQDEIERMKEYAQKEQQLHDALTKAIDKALRHDPLYLDDQMGVLAAAVMCAAFNHVSMHNVSVGDDGIDPNKYRLQLVNYMRQICYGIARSPFHYDPDAPMTPEKNEGKRKGGRLVMPDAANSWLRVFPSPLSAERLLRAVLIHTDDDRLAYNPDHVARKMLGVMLTSLPEADKKEIGERMKVLHLMQVKTPSHTRLQYVVFGAGEQASKKTQVIADRLAHQEIIEGIYFEDFLQVLDELEEMKAGYDADYEAQCEEDDDDDLPF